MNDQILLDKDPEEILLKLNRMVEVLNNNQIEVKGLAYIVTPTEWVNLINYFEKNLSFQRGGIPVKLNVVVVHYKGIDIFNPDQPKSSDIPFSEITQQ
jgi:hypothetical protein